MKVKTITQTCGACPSQWEGHLEDGRMIYVRYRWGCLRITVSKEPTDDVYDAVDGETVSEAEWGGGLDGYCTLDEVKEHSKELDWDATDDSK